MNEPPLEIPGFRLERELGRGASGVVYLARELALGREVALKVLRSGMAQSPEMRARFEREVRAAARVQHPDIVPVLATGETAGRLWYTMERIDGPSLDKVLAQAPTGRLPPARAARIVLEVGRMLAVAHAAGVTHRDVKPANVVLLSEPAPAAEASSATRRRMESWLEKGRRVRGDPIVDRPRLMDFGLASDAAEARLSESGMLIGTPGYMAPEQFRGRSGEVGPAADQWALGVMLYELLTGHLPFPTDDLPTLARLVAEEVPVPPSRLDPRIDRELETICLKCMEKAPRDRYASCEALVQDLERWLADEPIAARPPGPVRRLRAWARERPHLVTSLGAALLVVLGLGVHRLVAGHQLRARLSSLEHQARSAEAAGRWPEAEEAYEAWLANAPESVEARDGRERARAVQAVLAAEAAYERALGAVEAVRTAEREVEELVRRSELGARAPGGAGLGLTEARGSEPWWMREPAWTARVRAEQRTSALVLERAAAEQALSVALATAEASAATAGAEGARVRARLRSGLARWHLEEWRRTQARGETDQAVRHRLQVEHLEPGVHDEELGSNGTLTLKVDAVGAQAWLFRYVREADVLPRGGPRWIPLPWPDPGGERVPGAATRPPESPRTYAVALAERLAEEGSRPPAPDIPAPAGALPDDATSVATAVGRLRLTRYVARRDATTYPLEASPLNAIALGAPERSLSLPAGRYLVLVTAPGAAEVRLPFEIERRRDVRLAPGPLPGARSAPAGFVHVAAGPARPGATAETGAFLASRLEVTFAEWWEFLDDPRTRAENAPDLVQARGWRFVPRNAEGPLSRPGPDGRFEPVANPSRPVAHVSLYDLVGYPEPPAGETEPLDGQIAALAEALAASDTVGWGYLAWRTERSRLRAGSARAGDVPQDVGVDATGAPQPLRFTLPSALEWERLAAGGHGRLYPFGDELDWAYVKGGRSRRTNPVSEPVGLFADDESVFGVRDLAGSLAEWTATWNEKGKTFEVRGGSWALTDPAQFRIATSRAERPRLTSPTIGVRLVVRLPTSTP
jgi:formylglycine-generating enzyme required for sulfatase activity